jgi:hypothetical protein
MWSWARPRHFIIDASTWLGEGRISGREFGKARAAEGHEGCVAQRFGG